MRRSTTSLTLLEQAKAGTESAWRELQSLYTPLGYYWCRQAGVAARDAEEIWANVLGRVARKLGDFEHNGRPGAFRKWLRTITRNEILDFQRARMTLRPNDEFVDQLTVESLEQTDPDVEKSILYHRAWEMIRGEFSSPHCDIFRRVVELGQEPAEVAKEFGLQRATVYSILFRIRRQIAGKFQGELEES